MKELANILLPVPMRSESTAQRETAVKLALEFDARIHLYHCVPHYETEHQSSVRLLLKKMIGRLEEERKYYENRGLKALLCPVEEGIPYEGILHKAEELSANLILFGPAFGEGHNEIKVERVVKLAESPVWVANQSDFSAIACGIDFSAASKRAFSNALRMAKAFDSRVMVIHAEQAPQKFLEQGEQSEAQYGEWKENRQSRMKSFLQEFDTNKVEVSFHFLEENPIGAMQNLLQDEKINLFMLGTTGNDSGHDVRIGSLSQNLLKEEHQVSLVYFSRRDVIRIATHQKLEHLNKLLEKGWELLDQGQAEESLEVFENAIHLDSFSVHAWKGLAQARTKLGFTEDAKEAESRAREIRQYYWDRRIEQELRNRKRQI